MIVSTLSLVFHRSSTKTETDDIDLTLQCLCLAQKNELSNIQISSEGYLSECQ